MKFKAVLNEEKVNWQEDNYSYCKKRRFPILSMIIFFPFAIIISSALVLLLIISLPSTLDLVKAGVDVLFPSQEEVLKASAEEPVFSDILPNSEYYQSISFLKKNGMISGYDDNTFRVEKNLSRAELIKILISTKRVYPLALNYNNCFADVHNEWFAPSICLAKENGWVQGYENNKFLPNNELTRAEALKMILTSFDLKIDGNNKNLNQFADVKNDDWFYQYTLFALNNNLLKENPEIDLFNPMDKATRGFAVEIIYKVLQQF